MKFRFLFFALFCACFNYFGQENTVIQEDNSLNGQFDKIYRTSTNYQVYKVISKEKYLQLKKNVLDSVSSTKSLVSKKDNLLNKEIENNKETKALLSKTQIALETANKKENTISLFGLELSKLNYNLILWGLILALLLALFYFIFKFSRSNILTKEAKNSLLYVENEFEQHRKKSLEREQKLRRQLQDEINKHRNA